MTTVRDYLSDFLPDFRLEPARTALLVVDMQYASGSRSEGLGRLLGSLDPRALLSRGYAMVRDGEGAIVTTAGKAQAAGHLRLQFADGDVAVAVAEGGQPLPPAAPPAAPKPVRKPPPGTTGRGQGELF